MHQKTKTSEFNKSQKVFYFHTCQTTVYKVANCEASWWRATPLPFPICAWLPKYTKYQDVLIWLSFLKFQSCLDRILNKYGNWTGAITDLNSYLLFLCQNWWGNLIHFWWAGEGFSVGFWDNSGFILVDKFLVINWPLVAAKVCQLFICQLSGIQPLLPGRIWTQNDKKRSWLSTWNQVTVPKRICIWF